MRRPRRREVKGIAMVTPVLKRLLALVLCAAMASTGCASASMGRSAMQTPSVVNPAMMADYAQRIPAGSRVRLERSGGEVIRGTLMTASAQSVVIQRDTRIPEAPIEIPLDGIARLTLDNVRSGTSTAKAIGIGVASGVGAFFVILGILAATWDD
jgi:hypothetical protein